MAAWWELYPCIFAPNSPACREGGPRLSAGLPLDRFGYLSAPNAVRLMGIQPERDGQTRRAEDAVRASFGGEKALDRWRIVEIAWVKSFFAKIDAVGLLKDPRVAGIAAGTQDADDLNTVIKAATIGASAGAVGGTLVPGIGNVIGGLVGGIGGALTGLGMWVANAVGDGERKARLAQALGEVVLEVGYPPSKIALMVSRLRVQGNPTIDPFKALASLARYSKGIFQRETPNGWTLIPAFPWKIADSGGIERTVTAQQAANAMWTVKERALGVWPYLDAPVLTFGSQDIGDTPECSDASSRTYDRRGRAYHALDLGSIFPAIVGQIDEAGSFLPSFSAGRLIFQNQYSQRAQGSEAGVVMPSLACTNAITLDCNYLRLWGKQ